MLESVRHQSCAQRHLQRALSARRVPHAYLFHGPDGVGREKLARAFAQVLLCPASSRRRATEANAAPLGLPEIHAACGRCPDCRLVESDTHPDLHVVHRFLNRFHEEARVRDLKAAQIGVDVIRRFFIDEVGRRPVRGRAKVFILRDAHRLNAHAENALLKTLEEPPPDTFIILMTSSVEELLPTTRSRSQAVAFSALPAAFIFAELRQRRGDLPEPQAAWYAGRSGGSLGRALELIEENAFDLSTAFVAGWAKMPDDAADLEPARWQKAIEGLSALYRKRDPELSETESQRIGLRLLLSLSAGVFGEALRVRSGASDSDAAAKTADAGPSDAARRIAERLDAESACAVIDRFHRAETAIARNANIPLAIEAMLYDAAALMRGESSVDVLS
ncbi:MAG: hypothetical protein FLDDKLPJ_02865 [Phycisphaerae bacterium]|nr:hypothetical protein [Phycisphaerae bacterium]